MEVRGCRGVGERGAEGVGVFMALELEQTDTVHTTATNIAPFVVLSGTQGPVLFLRRHPR